MNKNLSIILAALVPLAAVLYILWGQREPQPAKVVAVQPDVIPTKKQASANSDVEKRKAIVEEGKAKIEAIKREELLTAQKFALETTPESIRRSVTNGLKDKENRYRSLMDSLNISHADEDQILGIVLERNLQCAGISIHANTQADFALQQFLRSGQGPVIEKARQDMAKIVGAANVKEIERLEAQIKDEIVKKALNDRAD